MHIYHREGSKFYWFTFNYKNIRYKGSTKKTNKRDADEWASQRRRQLIDESVGIFVREVPPTFAAFSDTFLEIANDRYQEKPQTLRFYKSKLKNLLKFRPLSNARVDGIDEEMVDRYKASRRGKIGVSTCNRELATLSVILHFAFERKLILRIPRIAKYPEGEGRTFVLSRGDEYTLVKASIEPLPDLILLLVDTGLRIGEALSLSWDDVHFGPIGNVTQGHLQVRKGKSRNAKRNIPLTTRAERLLKKRVESSNSDWVFPGRSLDKPLQVTSADHQFRKTCDSIVTSDGDKLFPTEFVLHSLRHTCLTRLGEQGVSAFEIMRIAGHASVVVSQRYVHPSPESAQKAIALLDAANSASEMDESTQSLPHYLPQSRKGAA